MSGITRRASLGAAFSVSVGALAGCSGGPPSRTASDPGTGQLKIASGSMEPTLAQGTTVRVQYVLPGKYQPKRQDVVFFHPPTQWDGFTASELLPGRVIGIPGDTVSCAGRGTPVMLNGAALKEPYLYPGDAASSIAFSVTVPSGRLWLLDDHRSVAVDGRYQLSTPDNGAFVPIADVVSIYIH